MTTLVMTRGDTAEFDVRVLHPETGDPVNIADAAVNISMAAATVHGSTTPEFELSRDSGEIRTVAGAENVGRALVTVPVAATSDMANVYGRLHWSVVVDMTLDGIDRVWTVDEGLLLVLPSVAA